MKVTFFAVIIFLFYLSGCSFINVSLTPSTKPLEEKVLEGKGTPKILLVDLDGIISLKEETSSLKLATKPSKAALFREVFRKAESDSDIVGVIIRINSPGGTVSASDTIYHEIMSFKQKRNIPVYAYIWSLPPQGAITLPPPPTALLQAPQRLRAVLALSL
jgi:protease-4